ncbi:MAG: tail fiber domain-containing protein [Flavobacterium sp.]|nr:tail fiber domain-containing protein [Flavobacterium sp.]
MKKTLLIVLFFITSIVTAQIGIGTVTPNSSAMLDITSTTKGLLIPRMTQAQKTAIATPATGLLIYQTDGVAGFYFYNGASWQQFSSGSSWSLMGNSGTNPGANQLGTTDAQPLLVKSNNTESLRILSNGNVVKGNTTSDAKLHIEGTSTSIFNDGFEDNTIPPFTTSGTGGNWTTTNTAGNFNSGTKGSQSGTGVHSSQSNLVYTTTLLSPGNIAFAFKASTESCCDKLRFLIDGVEQANWGGTVAWNTVSYPVTAGAHTFTWSYTKDSSVNAGDDKVYIDDVRISTPVPVLRIEDGNQANNYIMISDANGNGTWSNPATFVTGDDDWRFNSGSLDTDPIYRTGDVRIGATGTALYNLEVYNGNSDGSQIGIGSTEYVTDGLSENYISHSLVPETTNTISLGSASLRWSEVFASNGTINTSDARDKESIQPLSYGLSDLLKLKPVSYKWKVEKYGKTILSEKEKRHKIGFIAQDLQQVLPETVQDFQWRPLKDTDKIYQKQKVETLGVSYAEILPVVIKATQENQTTLDQIQMLLNETNAILKQLEKK